MNRQVSEVQKQNNRGPTLPFPCYDPTVVISNSKQPAASQADADTKIRRIGPRFF